LTVAPARAAILGKSTNYVSGNLRAARFRRFRLQDAARKLLTNWRVAWCYRTTRFDKSTVEVWHNHERGAHYRNLATCGSVWTCPVCASKITETRRAELQEVVKRSNFTKVMVTITLQHERGDSLAELVEALNDSWRRLKQGRFWVAMREEFELLAYVSASEFTYGQNGWHPHKHALFFTEIPEAEFSLDEFKARLTARYKAILAKHGRYASDLYGIDVRLGDDQAGEYASKWGLECEIAKASVKNGKGGFSPFQLLELYAEGEAWAGALFVEYAHATKGRRQLVWSHGGREVLGLGDEKTDEEIAADEETHGDGGNLLLVLRDDQWRVVLRERARLALLEIADSGDPWACWDFLESLGISPSFSQNDAALFGFR